jgi:hypothetical protein
MKKQSLFRQISFILLACVLLLTGCSSQETSASSSTASASSDSDQKRQSQKQCLLPEASGTTTYGNDDISIDASNTSEGYLMVRYQGAAEKTKVQITAPDQTVFTYSLAKGEYETFPLSEGDGTYHLEVLENAYDNMYALAFSQDVDVKLTDEFKPFLYPNQYVWFESSSKAVDLAYELSEQSSDDLDFVGRVYEYVITNITYDKAKAEDVLIDYLPDIDEVLASGTGICFDYASLMAAMLRCQGIPTKLEVGYSGTAYHSWISVYLEEIGWVDNIISFDGQNWSLMDPTLAASNNSQSVKDYIGDGSNYTVKYSY